MPGFDLKAGFDRVTIAVQERDATFEMDGFVEVDPEDVALVNALDNNSYVVRRSEEKAKEMASEKREAPKEGK